MIFILICAIASPEGRCFSSIRRNILQKYIFVPIDIYLKKKENIDINNRLNAWLLFLGSDDPSDIIRLIERYPEFKAMYQQIYEICECVEDMMGLFSKELAIMDENTVKYMMDEMQEEIDKQKEEIMQQDMILIRQKKEIDENKLEIDHQKAELAEKESMLAKIQAELQAALQRNAQLEETLKNQRLKGKNKKFIEVRI